MINNQQHTKKEFEHLNTKYKADMQRLAKPDDEIEGANFGSVNVE